MSQCATPWLLPAPAWPGTSGTSSTCRQESEAPCPAWLVLAHRHCVMQRDFTRGWYQCPSAPSLQALLPHIPAACSSQQSCHFVPSLRCFYSQNALKWVFLLITLPKQPQVSCAAALPQKGPLEAPRTASFPEKLKAL